MKVWTSACAVMLAAAAATASCDSGDSESVAVASSSSGPGTGAVGGGGSSVGGGAEGGKGVGGGPGAGGAGGRLEAEAPLCDVPPETASMGACVTLGGKIECNPVSQEGCDLAAGAACDTNIAIDGFACYPSDNVHELCEDCGGGKGFCKPGMACPGALANFGGPGLCSKYCCTDEDCGASGACSKELMASFGLTTGYCILKPI